ncbi:matrix metallopeptidase 23bb [Menidia menidia]
MHPLSLLALLAMIKGSPQASIRSRRYSINPLGQKWGHHNLTYRILRFPSSLGLEDTRRAIGLAFSKWSHVSPLSFREVAHGNADITMGFYGRNHSDCWGAALHPCFDGLNGELAHAFLPPRGEIHFDNQEAWVLGRSRYSWRRGVWLNDLVQVAAHEIGHVLGLWHSQDPRALMNPNATQTGQRDPGQDDIWGIQRLYGCLDKKRVCGSWARLGFCERRKTFMRKNCPRRCDLCYEPLEAVATPTPPPANLKIKTVPRGKVVGFRCGARRAQSPPQISWYKDGEQILASVPGYIVMTDRELRIVANEFNEGVYTCRVHRGGGVWASSWAVRLRPDQDQDQDQVQDQGQDQRKDQGQDQRKDQGQDQRKDQV